MFSDWLLQEMIKKGWSQADLARASGLTTAAVSKYMSGRVPEEGSIKKIANAHQHASPVDRWKL
jgi:transcriptional regulator with XRE-family HTH domain